jgi:carbon monoxide dehydrogenase subunit G
VLQVSASAAVSAPPADVFELLCGTARYSEWVTGTDALTRTEGPGVPELSLMLGQLNRRNRCTVKAFAQLATRELGEQARA